MRVGSWENGGGWDQSFGAAEKTEPPQLPQCLPRTRINNATNQSEEVNSTHTKWGDVLQYLYYSLDMSSYRRHYYRKL